jgi:hypothetical protein
VTNKILTISDHLYFQFISYEFSTAKQVGNTWLEANTYTRKTCLEWWEEYENTNAADIHFIVHYSSKIRKICPLKIYAVNINMHQGEKRNMSQLQKLYLHTFFFNKQID